MFESWSLGYFELHPAGFVWSGPGGSLPGVWCRTAGGPAGGHDSASGCCDASVLPGISHPGNGKKYVHNNRESSWLSLPRDVREHHMCIYKYRVIQRCARFAEFWQEKIKFQILWSLSSVDFHTFTLQLPIQTQNSVAPELQVFVSSLEISAKRAHPREVTETIGLNGLASGRTSLLRTDK